jgi:hypothetical protein
MNIKKLKLADVGIVIWAVAAIWLGIKAVRK